MKIKPMRFRDLSAGNNVYYVEIKDFQIVGGSIQKKVVKEIINKFSGGFTEVYFSDNTKIVTNPNEAYFIDNIDFLNRHGKAADFTMYSCSYEVCMSVLKTLLNLKLEKLCDYSNIIEEEITKVRLLKNMLEDNEDTEKEIVSAPIYLD